MQTITVTEPDAAPPELFDNAAVLRLSGVSSPVSSQSHASLPHSRCASPVASLSLPGAHEQGARVFTHSLEPPGASASHAAEARATQAFQLPSNPRTMAPEEQGVWMEVKQQKGASLFGSGRVLGEFFVVMDRRPQAQDGAPGERNQLRAQPNSTGTLRWYDNDGPHKRLVDAIDLGLITGADVTAKFEEVKVNIKCSRGTEKQPTTSATYKFKAPVLTNKSASAQAMRADDGKRAKALIVDELRGRQRPVTPVGPASTPLSLPTGGGSLVHTGGGRQLQGYAVIQLQQRKKGSNPWTRQWICFDTRTHDLTWSSGPNEPLHGALRTGRKAVQPTALPNRPYIIAVEGTASLERSDVRDIGISSLLIDLSSLRSKQLTLDFLQAHMCYVAPVHVKLDDVFKWRSETDEPEAMCDRLEWLLLNRRPQAWLEGAGWAESWAVLSLGGSVTGGDERHWHLSLYSTLQDPEPHTSIVIDSFADISMWRGYHRTILVRRSTELKGQEVHIVLRTPDDPRHHTWTQVHIVPLPVVAHAPCTVALFSPLAVPPLSQQALYHAKINPAPSRAGGITQAAATPLSAHPLIKRQLQFLCSMPDATQQLKEIGARSLAGGSSLASRLIDELTTVFVRLVGPIPAWWSSRPADGITDQAAHPAAEMSRLDDDLRLRRYTEMWCRFILIVEPPTAEPSAPARTEGGAVRAVDVVRAVLLALDLREAVRLRFRRLDRLQRASLLVELVEAMITWVSAATDAFKYSLLEYLGHPHAVGSPVRGEHIWGFVRQLQKAPEQRSLADFCELRLLLHPELSSVQQLRALRQASLRDRQDLRSVIAAVEKVPKHFRNLGRIRLSLAPFEDRTEVIDGVPWAPLRLRHPEEAVQLRLQLQLMRVLRELGVYDSEEVFRAVAAEAVREHTTLVALFFRELCQEDVPLFLSGDRVRVVGGHLRHLAEDMVVPLFDETGEPLPTASQDEAPEEPPPEMSMRTITRGRLSLYGSSESIDVDGAGGAGELTLEGVDEAVGALVQLPDGLRFFNVASRHKSKPTKKAVERDSSLIRLLLARIIDARGALEDKLRQREQLLHATTRYTSQAGVSNAAGVGVEGAAVDSSEKGLALLQTVTQDAAPEDVADLNAYGGLDECLFRCIESVLLVVASSTSNRSRAQAAPRDGHFRTFAARVVGDLVTTFSDPHRLAAFTAFIKHCQVNLPGLGISDVNYSDQAMGASLGSTEVMVTGLLRLVLALGQEQTLADFWALVQPNTDDTSAEFVLKQNRSLRDKFCQCLLDPGPHSRFVGVHSIFANVLEGDGMSRDLLMSSSFWTFNGISLWCKPADRISFSKIVRAALADTDDPLPFELFIDQLYQVALNRRETHFHQPLSTNFKDPYPTSMVLRCCLFAVLERLDEEVDPIREPDNFNCLYTLMIVLHAKNLITDEIIAELASWNYVRVIVRFVTDFFAHELHTIGEGLESPRASMLSNTSARNGCCQTSVNAGSFGGVAPPSAAPASTSTTSLNAETAALATQGSWLDSLLGRKSLAAGLASPRLASSDESETRADVEAHEQVEHKLDAREVQQAANHLSRDGNHSTQEGLHSPEEESTLVAQFGGPRDPAAACGVQHASALRRLPDIPPLAATQAGRSAILGGGIRSMRDVEWMIMCIANLATKLLDEKLLYAFNSIAPVLFDKFLAPHSPLYNKVCARFFHPLLRGLIVDHDLISDEEFWQEDVLYLFSRLPGSKSDNEKNSDESDSQGENEYYNRVGKAIRRSAANMVVLQKLLKELRISTARLSPQNFPLAAVRAVLRALLDYIGPLTAGQAGAQVTVRVQVPPSSYVCIETILSIGQHHGMLDPSTLSDKSSLLSLLVHSPWSGEALSNYGYYFQTVLEFNAPYIHRKTTPPSTNTKSRTPEALQAIILALLGLAMQRGKFLEAFKQIVPTVFQQYLKTGTPMRMKAIHMLLKEGMYFRIHDKFKPAIELDEDLMTKPFFWTEHVLKLFGPDAVDRIYPTLNGDATVYYDVVKLCLRLLEARGNFGASQGPTTSSSDRSNTMKMLLQRNLSRQGTETLTRPRGYTATFVAQNASMVKQSSEVLDTFENDRSTWDFFASVFSYVSKRSADDLDAFEGFELNHLSELAKSGRETLAKVGDLEKARKAMTKLFETYLQHEPPAKWKELFREAAKMAFNVKYMFREEVQIARDRFKENVQLSLGAGAEMFRKLSEEAFAEYGEGGLIDQEVLANSNFLTDPQELLDVVKTSLSQSPPKMRLIRQITLAWMEVKVDEGFPPLTPHHTQVLIMLMFAKFFEAKIGWPSKASKEVIPELEDGSPRFKALIGQMATGEGKSIVIAMLAIFVVKYFNRKVHILENNEGLLLRDHATYEPLYKKFDITSSRSVDATSQICYCLKKGNQSYFSRRMQEGTLDLSTTVLIVDEVDDLVVNEKPTANYVKEDRLQTPDLVKALAAAREKRHMPSGIDRKIWIQATNWVLEGDEKKLNIDYARVEKDGKPVYVELIDGKAPKVPQTHGWLIYLMYKDFGTPPKKFTPYLTMCTPYMYNKYECIFGLTGSVGGQAERDYIEKTFNAVPYQVPLFLTTCRGSGKIPARNKGVIIEQNMEAMIRKVCDLTIENYQKVPVLIITQGKLGDELNKVHRALLSRLENERMRSGLEFDPTSLMTLTERDEDGKLLDWNWKTVIEDTTKRTGTGEASHFHITVTDIFGGRGHDFNCNDEYANNNGGMLVIATSIPDTREWIQWKGRTARQDRPGQFYVVMSAQDAMFTDHKTLISDLKGKSDDDQIEFILRLQDEGINEVLSYYQKEQARGAWLNEMCDKYFTSHQRDNAEWPSSQHQSTDIKLRDLLSVNFSTGEHIRAKASEVLQLQIEGPPKQWGFAPTTKFGLQDGRQPMAITFLVDRTYDSFLQTVVNAVQSVYEEHLEEDDMVGYWGLGTGWIFEMTRKEEKHAEMLSQIKESAVRQGKSLLYSDFEKVLTALAKVDDSYSKWLILLSDLVDLENKTEAESTKVVSKKLVPQVKKIAGFNLVIIDASRIGRWKPEHPMWPTWEKNSKELTDAAQRTPGCRGFNIPADNPDAISEAFERVAALMQSGGVADDS
ncbi:hypothetical protein AB1Y20_000236 [Prymnesium parvum]|uniref:SecA DEAD-like N-terminal domain-containing protein n=1 Tax=Prymnesium parvum TaxID=97485 RepID=A0AB34K7A2_PRYPA